MLELHAQVMGEGAPLVVLHGLFGASQNWQTVARTWLAAKFEVHLLDLRNHGQSPQSDVHDYPSMAEDVGWYITHHISRGNAHVMGHSMGGKVAMQLAATQPSRVDRLVIVDMAPRPYVATHLEMIEAMLAIDPAAARSRKEVEEALMAAIPDRNVRMFLLTNLVRDSGVGGSGLRWRVNLDAIYRNYTNIIDDVDIGPAFTNPTLFVRGSGSDFIRDADWPHIQRLFSGAKLLTIEGAGHWVHADAPQALSEAVSAFLG
jgi:esterase